MEQSARKAYSRVGLAVALYAVATYVATFACIFVMAVIDKRMLQTDMYYWVAGTIPQYLVAFPIAFFLLRPIPKAQIEKKKLSFPKLLLFFIVCFGISMIASMTVNKAINMITALTGIRFNDVVSEMLDDVSIWYNIIIVAIIGPIFEELLFRKLIIGRLATYGQKSAIIISALLFGLLHGNLAQFFYATLFGIILGHIYCCTGKLRYTIAIHIGFNALAGVFTHWLSSNLDLDKLASLESSEKQMEFIADNLGYFILLIVYELLFIASIVTAAILVAAFAHREYKKLDRELLPRNELIKVSALNGGMISAFVVLAAQFILNIISYNL